MQNRTFLAALALIILILITACGGGAGNGGSAEVTLIVEAPEQGYLETYQVSTDAETLGELVDELEIGRYDDTSPMGRFLVEVDGIEADANSQYWSILVDGEYGMYGVDEQKLSEGEEFTLILTEF